ncbi:MAG: hypothetical protein CL532_06930 [Aestuariivita sp.]|nr:hypothetical protein [Aestuariivita sp.]
MLSFVINEPHLIPKARVSHKPTINDYFVKNGTKMNKILPKTAQIYTFATWKDASDFELDVYISCALSLLKRM